MYCVFVCACVGSWSVYLSECHVVSAVNPWDADLRRKILKDFRPPHVHFLKVGPFLSD